MISTRCCTPTGRSSTSASGSMSKPNRSASSRTFARAPSRSSRPPQRVVSWPSITFSATVKTGISMKCWWTIPMPAAIASPGPEKCCTLSSRRISPSSARYSPYSTFIRVDLPAPFSPSRAWISPAWTSRSMWSFATSAPKRLVIPRNSSFTSMSFRRGAAAVPSPAYPEPKKLGRTGAGKPTRRPTSPLRGAS